jgi:Secretion system C-terminal sorting domain
VDVKKTLAASAFSIYPNPSEGIVELKGAPKNFTLELYSALGAKVFSQFYSNTKKIDLSFLDPGIYLLKLITAENNFEVKKLMIK